MARRIPSNQIGLHFVFLIVLLLLIMGGVAIQGYINQKNEKEYTDESKLNDVVYADIVSITPNSGTVDARKKTTHSYIGFFCTCETVDGKRLSAYITNSNFDRYIKKRKYSWDTSTMPDKVEFDTPLRIHGRVSNRKSIVSSSVGDELLFEIYKAEQLTVMD